MTTLDARARGRRNRERGQEAERRVATFLREVYPDARRAVVNGWATADHAVADPGDIDGTGPDKWWSVRDRAQVRIDAWMAELHEKAGARLGLLVVRRRGTADVGRWPVYLRLADLSYLLGVDPPTDVDHDATVSLELRQVRGLLATDGAKTTPIDSPTDRN